MELLIGILITSIASLAILLSIWSMYQLWKGNALTKEFFKKKGPKFIVLYGFWMLLFAGGILFLQKEGLSIFLLKAALVLLLLYVSVKLLASVINYSRIFFDKKESANDEEGNGFYTKISRKSLLVDFVGWSVILGITIFMFSFLETVSFAV